MNLRSKFLVFIIVCISACTQKPTQLTEQQVATSWAKMALFLTKNTPANTPTYASRCFGYIGLTMYESIVAGYPDHNSVASELNGLTNLPKIESNKTYDWVLSLNAGQAQILRTIYNQTSDINKVKIDSLEKVIYKQFADNQKDTKVIERSVTYGKSVANTIFEWSKTDG
ncbi:MAG: phosphoesterase, partial [Spirosomaceae bacterium]|nr:phosphoesterase [Spirosomataceae bacterium]